MICFVLYVLFYMFCDDMFCHVIEMFGFDIIRGWICSVLICFVMICFVFICYVFEMFGFNIFCILICTVLICYVMICSVLICYVMICSVLICYVMICSVCAQLYLIRLKSEKVKSPKKLDLKKESSFKKQEKKTDRIRTRHSSLESEGDISKLSQGKEVEAQRRYAHLPR